MIALGGSGYSIDGFDQLPIENPEVGRLILLELQLPDCTSLEDNVVTLAQVNRLLLAAVFSVSATQPLVTVVGKFALLVFGQISSPIWGDGILPLCPRSRLTWFGTTFSLIRRHRWFRIAARGTKLQCINSPPQLSPCHHNDICVGRNFSHLSENVWTVSSNEKRGGACNGSTVFRSRNSRICPSATTLRLARTFGGRFNPEIMERNLYQLR
jgi:hypothetical protein